MSESKSASFLDKLKGANSKYFGKKKMYVGTDKRVVGLEPYSLALQYLIDLEVIPLQSIIVLAGEPKSYKTSALLELCRMPMILEDPPGFGVVINTEGKWSNSKAESMLRHNSDQIIIYQAASIQEWQQVASTQLKFLKDTIDKKESIKNKKSKTAEDKELLDMVIPPMFVGIDSLTGSQTDNIKDKVHAAGHGEKTFQDRSLVNWQWFNTWSSDLVGLPASVIITQHLKAKIDGNPTGLPIMVTSGGTGGSFMCSLEIRTKKIKEISKADYEGARLKWQTYHSSLGRDRRAIEIEYIETYDESGSQIAYFDWDTALVDCIMEHKSEKLYRDRIQECVGNIVEYSKKGVGSVYTCDALGIDKEKATQDNITAPVLGAMLQQPGSEMRKKLKEALLIQPCEIWTPETEL